MRDKRFGLKVLAGILIGALVGFLLLYTTPVPTQPGDVIRATLTDGREVYVDIGEDRYDPAVPEVVTIDDLPDTIDEQAYTDAVTFIEEVLIVGRPLPEVPALLTRSSGLEFTDVSVFQRGTVTIRPFHTELIYLIGHIFLRLLQMLVLPLIVATVLVGIASLGDIKKLGKLGKQTAGFYIATMLVAVTIGLFWVNLVKPGQDLGFAGANEIARADQTFSELILRTIPNNPFAALATLDVVAVLFFVIIFALAMLKLGKQRIAPVFNFFEGLNDVMFTLIGWVMVLAPIGVGALVAHTIGTQDVTFIGPLLASLGKFALTVTLALATHFIALMIILSVVARYSPIAFIRAMAPAMATAFGTNSSSATLPVTMTCIEKMGVSKRIRNFVAPVGATLNMDGTALFEAVAVLFFAQAFAVSLGIQDQFIVALVSVVAAIGAAGIPSAGLVTMVIVLSAVGLPQSKVALLWSIDRPLDMMRTLVNITGDAVTSRVVQTWNPDIKIEEDDIVTEYEPVVPEAAHGH